MRICSLLPSGTEILYALGLGDAIVGVSHECDYPDEAREKPKVVRAALDAERLSSEEIDRAVRSALSRREPLYQIDAEGLRRAQPDLILTQELCEVCAIGADQVSEAARLLPTRPRVVSLHPHTLREMLEEIRLVGEATGRAEQAERLMLQLQERLDRVQHLIEGQPRPRVLCLEWLSPPMASGHWVPEQVERAGGQDVLGRVGTPSQYVTAEEIVASRPEIVVLMPCGFSIERTRRELQALTAQPWWAALPAVERRQVYLVDGPAYFNRSGPRLIDGVELLASLFHPDRCASLGVRPHAAGAADTARL